MQNAPIYLSLIVFFFKFIMLPPSCSGGNAWYHNIFWKPASKDDDFQFYKNFSTDLYINISNAL